MAPTMKTLGRRSVVTLMTQSKDATVSYSDRSRLHRLWILCLLAPSVAAAPASQPDWMAQFLAEAPAEYARLENTVGRWEMNYVVTDTYYALDDSGKVVRQIVNRCRTVFDDRLGGIRSEVNTISPTTRPGALVTGFNPEYEFEVDKQGDGPYVMAQFEARPATQSLEKRWFDQLQNHRAFEAEDFAGHSLLRSVQTGQVKITSVSTVDMNGHPCVRFDCERVVSSGPRPGTYPGWVIADPSFHWAVRSYEAGIPGGSLRRVSIEYNPTLTEVAFPQRIIQDDFGRHGHLWMRSEMVFEDPKPSHAAAADFTLESFGLATPLAPPATKFRNVGVIVLITGTILVALIVAFAFDRQRRRGKVTPESGHPQ
jgi:hypothetical protein